MTDLTRFSVDGCMEPDDEGQWVRYEDVAAPVAPALKYVDDPKQTGVGSWCAPGPAAEQKRMFVLRFEDQDRGEAHYTDEAEARAMFARAEARGWNCHLFVHVNRVAPVAPAEPAEGWVLVPKRMTQEMRDVTDSEGWTWEDLLAEVDKLQSEIENLHSVMVAAAEEIHEHWQAHCDEDGYGPANLMHRLEKGIPAEYAYKAGDFERLMKERDAAVARLDAAVRDARMAGVHSVHEQTAVIVRAALELLECVDGCDTFPPEKLAAFRRVFGG